MLMKSIKLVEKGHEDVYNPALSPTHQHTLTLLFFWLSISSYLKLLCCTEETTVTYKFSFWFYPQIHNLILYTIQNVWQALKKHDRVQNILLHHGSYTLHLTHCCITTDHFQTPVHMLILILSSGSSFSWWHKYLQTYRIEKKQFMILHGTVRVKNRTATVLLSKQTRKCLCDLCMNNLPSFVINNFQCRFGEYISGMKRDPISSLHVFSSIKLTIIKTFF